MIIAPIWLPVMSWQGLRVLPGERRLVSFHPHHSHNRLAYCIFGMQISLN